MQLMQWVDDSPNKKARLELPLDKNKSNKDFILNIFGKETILKENKKLNLDNKFINIINCELLFQMKSL